MCRRDPVVLDSVRRRLCAVINRAGARYEDAGAVPTPRERAGTRPVVCHRVQQSNWAVIAGPSSNLSGGSRMTNLANNLRAAIDTCPDRTAFRYGPAAFTYSEFGQASASAAAWLVARGITPGDRIALMLPNGDAFPVLYYAIVRGGGIVLPIPPL